MKNLDDAIDRINTLKGEALGMQAMINSILRAMPPPQLAATLREFDQEAEAAQVALLHSDRVGEPVLRGLDTYIRALSAIRR